MKIRTLLLLLALFQGLGSLHAQQLLVHKTDGTIITIDIAEIDSITFMDHPGFNCAPCLGTPTVTDGNGNTYTTVQISQQCWMAENQIQRIRGAMRKG